MKKLFLCLAAISVVATATVIYAGLASTVNVVVVTNADGSGYMYGSFNSARNSADNIQYIGCNVTNNSVISCQASNIAGDTAAASSTDADYIELINSLCDHSYLYLRFDSNSTITYMLVAKRSKYLPAH